MAIRAVTLQLPAVLQKGNFYELTGKIPKTTLAKLVTALQELGDLPNSFTVERLLMPGVAELAN